MEHSVSPETRVIMFFQYSSHRVTGLLVFTVLSYLKTHTVQAATVYDW